jgi:serine/threonine protein kinase
MTDAPSPDSLRPGDLVGPWRIEGYAGRGSYGAVYRARHAQIPNSPRVALKLAVFPNDPRFHREAGLLSRVRHPSVPQLLGQGTWATGPEAEYPYLILEWIPGLPLYEWARRHSPSSSQVFQVVAQIASALDALHRDGFLHRDVKGDNLLVGPDGRSVLLDYGSCTWAGAPPLTDRLMPPNTREYLSPEALQFEWQHWDEKQARYKARPADDLYALAVAIYHLVTRTYPPPGVAPEEFREELGPPPQRVPARELNERVVPEMSELLERMLAEEPEARGTAREVAKAVEAALAHAGPEAAVPLHGQEPPRAATA